MQMNEAEVSCPEGQNDNWVGKTDCSPTVNDPWNFILSV